MLYDRYVFLKVIIRYHLVDVSAVCEKTVKFVGHCYKYAQQTGTMRAAIAYERWRELLIIGTIRNLCISKDNIGYFHLLEQFSNTMKLFGRFIEMIVDCISQRYNCSQCCAIDQCRERYVDT